MIQRVILFFFTYLIVLSVFYVLGNFQNFLDSSVRIILFSMSICSILLVIFCVYGTVLSLIFTVAERRISYIPFLLTDIVFGCIGAALLVFSRGILFLSSGIS